MVYDGHGQHDDHSTTLPTDGSIRRPSFRAPTWTWQAVQDRMAEAMRHWWRSPDAEARFNLGGRISSVWQQATDADVALIDRLDWETATPRALPLSREDVRRMIEASDWLRFVPEADRRLVVLVLVCLAKGDKKVPWLKLKRRLGVPFGADGLRMRYSRAITQVAKTLNSAENREAALSMGQMPPASK